MSLKRFWIMSQGGSFRAQLIRSGAGSLVVKIANVSLSFLVAITLARTLGADGYGVFAFAMALVWILAIPAQVGIPQVVLRETAKAAVLEDWALMRGLWWWSTRIVLAFSAILLLVGFGVLYVTYDTMDSIRANTLAVAFLLIPLLALGNLRGAALRGLHHVVLGQLPEAVLRPGGLLLVIAIVVFAAPSSMLTPPMAMSINAAVATGAFGVGAWMLWTARPTGVRANPLPKTESTYWWRASVPLALTGGVQLINSQADIVILGIFRTNEEVGIYQAVVQSALLITFVLTAANQVLAPYFSRLYTAGDLVRLKKLVKITVRIASLFATALASVFIVFSEDILTGLFGVAFAAGGIALSILALGQLVNVVIGPVAVLLNMTGHEKSTMIGVGAAAAANIIMNLLLIPKFGMAGAAISTACTLAAWNIILAMLVNQRLGISVGPL